MSSQSGPTATLSSIHPDWTDLLQRYRQCTRRDDDAALLEFAEELQEAVCSDRSTVLDALPQDPNAPVLGYAGSPAEAHARVNAMVKDIRCGLREIIHDADAAARTLQKNKPRHAKQLRALEKQMHVLKRAWDMAEAPDPSKPEPDLLGMCAGQPHYTKEQLVAKGMPACLCRKCLAGRKYANFMESNRERMQELQDNLDAVDAEISAFLRQRNRARRVVRPFKSRGWNIHDNQCVDDSVFSALDSVQAEPALLISSLKPSPTTIETAPSDGNAEHAVSEVMMSISEPVVAEHIEDDEEIDQEETSSDCGSMGGELIATEEWRRVLCTCTQDDLPLKVVFLDKSGSMGCDTTAFRALGLAGMNALHPSRGSTLTFLMSAPGETQMIFRRPSDGEYTHDIQLGSATWFNEPIVRTLAAVAPVLESLDVQRWSREHGEPPVQVLCMTDGLDNCSPTELSTLAGLSSAVRAIVAPTSGRPLYLPISGPLEATRDEVTGRDAALVPVWLVWIALGCGGSGFLHGTVPKGITIVDAVTTPCFRAPPRAIAASSSRNGAPRAANSTHASRAKQRAGAVSAASVVASGQDWQVGHRVAIKAASAGRAPKSGHILEFVHGEDDDNAYAIVLFGDERQEQVAMDRLTGRPAPLRSGFSSKLQSKGLQLSSHRTGTVEEQAQQVLMTVHLATSDMSSMMQSAGQSSRVPMESCIGAGDVSQLHREVSARLDASAANMNVIDAPTYNLSPAAFTATMFDLGRSACNLDSYYREFAACIASLVCEMLISGGVVHYNTLWDGFEGHARLLCPKPGREVRLDSERILQPVWTLLTCLETAGIINCTKSEDRVYCAVDGKQGVLYAFWRFFELGTDSFRRCVDRYERMQAPLACATRTRRSSEPQATVVNPLWKLSAS